MQGTWPGGSEAARPCCRRPRLPKKGRVPAAGGQGLSQATGHAQALSGARLRAQSSPCAVANPAQSCRAHDYWSSGAYPGARRRTEAGSRTVRPAGASRAARATVPSASQSQKQANHALRRLIRRRAAGSRLRGSDLWARSCPPTMTGAPPRQVLPDVVHRCLPLALGRGCSLCVRSGRPHSPTLVAPLPAHHALPLHRDGQPGATPARRRGPVARRRSHA